MAMQMSIKKIKSQTLRKISRQASSLPYPVLPVDDPPPFWQMLVALRLEDSKSDWKTWLFFAPFDFLFWIFLLFSYLASILTIVPHTSFGPALQSDPSNVQLHLLRDMELCFFPQLLVILPTPFEKACISLADFDLSREVWLCRKKYEKTNMKLCASEQRKHIATLADEGQGQMTQSCQGDGSTFDVQKFKQLGIQR